MGGFMQWRKGAIAAAAVAAATIVWGGAAQGQAPQGRGGGRGGVGAGLFTALDADKDGGVTRDEMRAGFDKWYGEWDSAKSNALAQE
jgi:hypothetical protein